MLPPSHRTGPQLYSYTLSFRHTEFSETQTEIEEPGLLHPGPLLPPKRWRLLGRRYQPTPQIDLEVCPQVDLEVCGRGCS